MSASLRLQIHKDKLPLKVDTKGSCEVLVGKPTPASKRSFCTRAANARNSRWPALGIKQLFLRKCPDQYTPYGLRTRIATILNLIDPKLVAPPLCALPPFSTHAPQIAANFDNTGLAMLGLMAELALLGLVLLPASVLFVGVFFQPRLMMMLTARLFPSILFLWPTKSKVVALTIDDSPHDAVTPEVLDVLKEHDSKATFFIIGSYLDKWPHLADQMHKEGHELGNHTMEDAPSWKLSKDEMERQLLETDARLQPYWSENSIKWFRPGHGWFTQSMLATLGKHGYRIALGSLFPHDPFFVDQGPMIAKYLLARVYPGAIIILHDGKPSRRQLIDALRILLPELKRRGYRVVTLSTLVGEEPKASSVTNAGRSSKSQ